MQAIALASGVRVRSVLLAGKWSEQENGPLLAYRASGMRPVALLHLPDSGGCGAMI